LNPLLVEGVDVVQALDTLKPSDKLESDIVTALRAIL
jgi:hypothetical protein